MISEFLNEFRNLNVWQQSIFVLMTAGFVFLGLHQVGIINLSKANVDCQSVAAFQTINVKVGDSFDPQEIHAKICDHLIFTAMNDKGSWIAVGPHPAHSSYPGFDTQRDLRVGESFTVVLNRAGNYSFHDHSHPRVVGSIVIDR